MNKWVWDLGRTRKVRVSTLKELYVTDQSLNNHNPKERFRVWGVMSATAIIDLALFETLEEAYYFIDNIE